MRGSLLFGHVLAADVDGPVVVVDSGGDRLSGLEQLWNGDDAPDSGVLELAAELVHRVQGVGERDDEAGLQAGVHRHQVLGHVGQQQAHPIARFQARRREQGPRALIAHRLRLAERVRPA